MTLANTKQQCESILDMLQAHVGAVAFDVETTGKDENTADLVGFSVSDGEKSFYIPVAHRQGANMSDVCWRKIMDAIAEHGVIAHNAKYDVMVMQRHGWDLPIAADTMLLAYVTHARGGFLHFGLKYLVEFLFNYKMTNFKDLFPGLKPKQMHFEDLPVDVAAEYAADDSYWTYRLYQTLLPLLNKNTEQIYKLEMAVLPYVMQMQRYGLPMDVEAMRQEGQRLQMEAAKARRAFYALVEAELGRSAYELEQAYPINSPAKAAKLLYEPKPDGLGLRVYKRTPTGKPSTDRDALKPHVKNPIVMAYMAWKEMTKTGKDFYLKIAGMVADDGRLRASINQAGATTGRFGTSNPNIQNFPKKRSWRIYKPDGDFYEVETNFRNMMVAPEGYKLLQLDYSQIEFRLMAGLVGAKVVLDAYKTGADMHVRTYAFCFQVPEESVTKEQRAVGKTINFALIYGMGPERLQRQLGGKYTLEEATMIHRRYFQLLPELSAMHDRVRRDTAKTHMVTTYFGREQLIPEFFESSRLAQSKARRAGWARINQGSAADLMKLAIVKVGRMLSSKYPAVEMILTLHDALFFLVPDDEQLEQTIRDIRREMELELDGFPPIVTGIALGDCWGCQEDIELSRGPDDVQVAVASASTSYQGLRVLVDSQATPNNLRKLKEQLVLSADGQYSVAVVFRGKTQHFYTSVAPLTAKALVESIPNMTVELLT